MDPTPARQAVGQDAERTIIVIRQGDEVRKLELVTSTTPLDPSAYPGWWLREVNTGYIAVRIVV